MRLFSLLSSRHVGNVGMLVRSGRVTGDRGIGFGVGETPQFAVT